MNTNASVDELIKALWGSEARSAADAIRARGVDALPALLKALKEDDRNFEMRDYENGYLRSLIIDLGEPAFQALLQALQPRSNLVRAAAKTLKRWGDRRAVEHLVAAMLDEHTDLNDNHYIIEALGAFKDPNAFEPLKTMLGHRSQFIRRFAACALAEYGDLSVLPAIFAALKPGGQRYWHGTVESIGEILRTFHTKCENNGLGAEFMACLLEMERLHPEMVAEYKKR